MLRSIGAEGGLFEQWDKFPKEPFHANNKGNNNNFHSNGIIQHCQKVVWEE